MIPISAFNSCNNILEGENWDQLNSGDFPDFMSGDTKNTLLKDFSASLDDIYPNQACFTKLVLCLNLLFQNKPCF